MKTTKKQITEKTRSTEVQSMNLGRLFNHYYQHAKYNSFELKYNEPIVYHHVGPNSYQIGEARTKKEFIEIIYRIVNN